ncbi:MAG: bifunctional DNA-formamidopyrimidine glycosylase/DNA-(apurinic or apyrimidinic site) lyase [Planctomycetes bacterium]|nr:bifunctional DNA-formamidopyrimidine glycosylase/DNA-(apurinic or apyrimidinic site) lyase [Planctomycetota bacterium]
MPELPEVETVVRLIRPGLEGRTIRGAQVLWKRTLGGLAPSRFAERVIGARVVRVWRRAKFVVADLERDGGRAGALLGHLRMTGRMHVEPAGWDAGPYERLRLELDNRRCFHFIDVRKFGRLTWVADAERALAGLGPEPLGDAFSAAWLAGALRARRGRLKPLLLDQTFVAGLGNIYVDEALHRSGLHPLRAARSVRSAEAERLHEEIRATLTAAIARNGSSFDTFYRTPEGQPGEYQAEFRVYARDGQPCSTCATEIERIVVGQRGTHYCPRCQPRRPAAQARSPRLPLRRPRASSKRS